MAKNQEDLANWCLIKAEEYLGSARGNMENDRLYPAAEEIFRAIETVMEALLYLNGVDKIQYYLRGKQFVGRLALQYLIRDNLLKQRKISKQEHDFYLAAASELHQAAYTYGASFDKEELEKHLEWAENLFFKARALQ